jgi:CheY-like chemotaxis protein
MFKILIVDDESLIRYCLSATFRDPAFSVRTAASGAEALIAIRENAFDICILDLHLPDMNGIDIMQNIRTTSPETKVIVISGESLTREHRKIVEDNAVLYLDKPFDLDQVRSIVTKLSDQRLKEGVGAGDWSAWTERRRHVRRPADKPIRYSAVAPGGEARAIDQEARLRDISDTGMRLSAGHPLEPGWWMLLSDGNRVNEGIVRWSTAAQPAGTFDIGVQISQSGA